MREKEKRIMLDLNSLLLHNFLLISAETRLEAQNYHISLYLNLGNGTLFKKTMTSKSHVLEGEKVMALTANFMKPPLSLRSYKQFLRSTLYALLLGVYNRNIIQHM